MSDQLHYGASQQQGGLASRPAGYSVVLECLTLQAQAVPRSRLKRILGFRPLHPDANPWYSGALGEIHVGKWLDQLGPEWTVLHAVSVGIRGSDIDHVVLGPAGVFTINTKHHAGAKVWVSPRTLLVNGQKTDHLRNSRHEAKRASKVLTLATGLSVTAHPLLVIVGAASITIRESPDDVTILSSTRLVRWLNRRKPTHDAATLERIVEAASRSTNWTKVTDAPIDAAHMTTFAALREEVDQSRVRRLAWTVAGMLLFVVAVFQLVPGWVSDALGS